MVSAWACPGVRDLAETCRSAAAPRKRGPVLLGKASRSPRTRRRGLLAAEDPALAGARRPILPVPHAAGFAPKSSATLSLHTASATPPSTVLMVTGDSFQD